MKSPRAPDQEFSHFQFVAMMASMGAMNALGIDMMIPALALIAHDFGVADDNERQLVIGLYTLGMALGSFGIGFLADRFGRRLIAIVSIAGYGIGNIACALAWSYDVLLAARLATGLIAAGATVMAITVIRDRFYGDEMARMQSLVAIVFMAIPILAPGLGQLVLVFGGWREIFLVMAVTAVLIGGWLYLRLPETLHERFRQPISARTLLANFLVVARNRDAAGYILGTALVMGGLFGFINSAQQLIGEHFGAGDYFVLIFGLMASSLILTNFVNARIVERYGARPVSHVALACYIASALVQVLVAHHAPDSLVLFMIPMMLNLALFGFLNANFTSIALQPFGRLAGAASSLQTTVRLGGGALIGILLGAAYDGSALPLGFGLLALGVMAMAAILYSERGQLFRRRSMQITQV